MKEHLNVGVVGLGGRGVGLLEAVMYRMKDITVSAVCDIYEDRIEQAQKLAKKMRRSEPKGYTDYHEILNDKSIDAVIITASWSAHSKIALDAMRAGKPVGMEVGGAYTIDECWDLVNCYEETKTPFMMLENCCYGEYELAVLRMVREGIFGDVVHCGGGYKHDLRYEVSFGEKNRHYRLHEYMTRNCENYPTHEIGPIAKVLNINYGNRMVSLTSTASCSKGLHRYITDRMDKYDNLKKLKDVEFAQGDIVTTVIKCANGETISIQLDTTLPRMYSRGFEVHGTKAYYTEDGNVFVDDNSNPKYEGIKSSGKRMVKKYRHPIWKWFKRFGVKGGHGGMDWLVFKAFFDSVRKGDGHTPIDVYDAACWMSITALSAQSIENNSACVEFPDFTRGEWKTRKQQGEGMFFLE